MLAEQPYMSTGAAAAYLGVSRRTLSRWIEDGKVRATVLPSGRYRLHKVDLDAVLARTNEPAAKEAVSAA